MTTIQRLLINLGTDDLKASTNFYTSLFGFDVQFDSDWFVQLVAKNGQLELGLIVRDHELIPEEFRGKADGMYLTIVVDDLLPVYNKAVDLNFPIVLEPELTSYGQRRFLVKDPGGVLVDVSAVDNG